MSFGSRNETVENLITDKEYRDFYTQSYLKKSIPFQMRTMRSERNLNQTQAAEILGKGQNALSRLESPAYGRLTLQTLLDIAKGYDVGLIVKFVPFSRLVKEYEDVSFEGLQAPSPTEKFPDEIQSLNDWANEEPDSGFWEEETGEVEESANHQPSQDALETIAKMMEQIGFTRTESLELRDEKGEINPTPLALGDDDQTQMPRRMTAARGTTGRQISLQV